ncbi:unnamed protein product [Boreogadus saida]
MKEKTWFRSRQVERFCDLLNERQQGAAVSSMLRQVSFAFGLLGAIWEHQHGVKAYVVIREKGRLTMLLEFWAPGGTLINSFKVEHAVKRLEPIKALLPCQ